MKGARIIAGLTFLLALTGLLLAYSSLLETWRLAIGVVLIHLLAACFLLLMVLPFLWNHVRGRGRLKLNNITILVLLGAMLLTGVALTAVGHRGYLPIVHSVSSLAFVVVTFLHTRSRRSTARGTRTLVLKLSGVALMFVAV